MTTARDRRVLLALAGIFALLALVAGSAGLHAAFAYVVPVVAMLVPLVLGRFPGERIIASLRRRRECPRRPRRSLRLPARPAFDLVPRGTSLMARCLAVRPPPLVAS